MTDLLFPDVRIQRLAPRLIDNTGRFSSPFTQATRTISRGGDRWGFTLTLNDLAGVDRARVESLIANLRGAANRVLFSPIDFPQRGSFPSAEKLANNNFANGTTGWLVQGGTISVTDRRLRLTFNGGGVAEVYQSVSNFTPNLPYVARYILVDGKGAPLALGAMSSDIEGSFVNKVVSGEGLNALPLVVDQATGTQFIMFATGGATPIPTGQIAGNYAEAVWTSISQCMLVDNGPNLLQFSDTLASPWTYSAASVTAGAATAADGTGTAAAIVDTAANVAHYAAQGFTVGSAPADFMVCGEFKAAARGFAFIQLQENTGGTAAYQILNLSTGALGTPSTGVNWANARYAVVPLGNGWYYFAVVARKTNAATSLSIIIGPAASSSAFPYVGAATQAIFTRRITASQSSVPAQQVQSTNAAVPAIAQVGSALKVKGLPASAQGLLLADDWFEINRELKKCTAQLDSNAAGLGYLQFSPPLRNSPADNDPVIVNMPMGRFIMSASETGWDSSPAGLISGPRATYTLDLIEAA